MSGRSEDVLRSLSTEELYESLNELVKPSVMPHLKLDLTVTERQQAAAALVSCLLQRHTIDGSSRQRRFVSAMCIIVALYYIAVVPFRLAFLFDPAGSIAPLWGWLAFEWLVDIVQWYFFIIEVRRKLMGHALNRYRDLDSFNLLRAAEEHTGEGRPLAELLLTKQVCIELLSLLPLELFAFAVGPAWVYPLRSLKALRYLLIDVYFARLKGELRQSLRDAASSSWMWFLRMLWVMLHGSHWVACLFLLLNHLECGQQLDGCEESMGGADLLQYSSPLRQYVRLMYWAVVSLVTVGFGDMVPLTNAETVFTILAMTLGMLVSTRIVATFAFVYDSYNTDTIQNESLLDDVEQFIVSRKLPKQLGRRLLTYFEYVWTHYRGVDEQALLAALPSELRMEALDAIQNGSIQSVPFFRAAGDHFLRSLSAVLQPRLFCPGDEIIHAGQAGRAMFSISRGAARVTATTGDAGSRPGGSRLTEGSFFGEMVLFDDDAVNSETVRAITYCETLQLTREDFQLVMTALFSEHAGGQTERMKERAEHAARQRAKLARLLGSEDNAAPGGPPGSPSAAGAAGGAGKLADGEEDDLLASDSAASKTVAWNMPGSVFRRRWQAVRLFCIALVTLVMPFRSAFLPAAETTRLMSLRGGQLPLLLLMDMLVDVFFIVDALLRALYFARAQSSRLGMALLICDRGELWAIYRSSSSAIIDAVCSLPLDWIVLAAVPTSGTAAAFWLGLRQLKMLRMLQAPACWRELQLKQLVHMNRSLRRLLTIFVGTLLVTHLAGCMWYYLSYAGPGSGVLQGDAHAPGYDACLHAAVLAEAQSSLSVEAAAATTSAIGGVLARAAGSNATASSAACSWAAYDGLRDSTNLYVQWVRACYWAMVALSTVGYGDIRPFTVWESLFAFIFVWVGGVLYYALVGAISYAMTTYTARERSYMDRVQEMNRFLAKQNAPPELCEAVRAYFRHTWETTRGLDEQKILSALPAPLLEEVSAYENRAAVSSLAVFDGVDEDFLRVITTHFQRRLYLPGDIIFDAGDPGNELYLVHSGTVELFHTVEERVLGAIGSGSAFGETSFFMGKRHAAFRVVAASMVEMNVLNRASYESVIRSFPGLDEQLQRAAAGVQEAYASMNDRVQRNMRNAKVRSLLAGKGGIGSNSPRRRPSARVRPAPSGSGSGSSSDKLRSLYVAPRTPQDVILPDSPLAEAWNVAMLALTLYHMIVVPFHMAFLEQQHWNSNWLQPWMALEFVLDLLLWVDIWMNARRLAVRSATGELLTDTAAIWANYRKGALRVDLLAALPLAVLAWSNVPLLTLLRLPRLLRLLQLGRRLERVEHAVSERSVGSAPALLRLASLASLLLLASHWAGCGFFLVSRYASAADPTATTWVRLDGLLDWDVSLGTRYVRSLYWALSTLTVVCYGDITPKTTAETQYTFVICIVGLFLIGHIVGNIADLVTNMDSQAAEYQSLLDQFHSYCIKRRLPSGLQDRIQQFLDYRFARTHGLHSERQVALLPDSLQLQLADALYGGLLRQQPLLSGLPAGLLRRMAARLKPQLYLPNDYVIRERDIGKELFLVKEGMLNVLSESLHVSYATLEAGQLCGELAFLLPGRRRISSVQAITYSELLVLSREDWVGLMDMQDDALASMRAIALETADSYEQRHAAIVDNFTRGTNKVVRLGQKVQLTTKLHRLAGTDARSMMRYTPELPTPLRRRGRRRKPRRESVIYADIQAQFSASRTDEPASTLVGSLRRSLSGKLGSSLRNSFRGKMGKKVVPDASAATAAAAAAATKPSPRMISVARGRSLRKRRSGQMFSSIGSSSSMDDDGKDVDDSPPVLRVSPSKAGARHVLLSKKSSGSARIEVTAPAVPSPTPASSSAATDSVTSVATVATVPSARPSSMRRMSSLERLPELESPKLPLISPSSTLLPSGGGTAPFGPPGGGDHRHGSEAATDGRTGRDFKRHRSRRMSHAVQVDWLADESMMPGRTSLSGIPTAMLAPGKTRSLWSRFHLPPFSSLPNSGLRRLWDVALLTIYCYHAYSIPYRLAFQADVTTESTAWWVLQFALDGVLLLDIYFNASVFSYIHMGEVVTDRARIAERYRREWLVLDVLASLPLDMLALLPVATLQTPLARSMYRLTKLLRLSHLQSTIAELERYVVQVRGVRIRLAVLRLVKALVASMLIAHLVGCMWYMAGLPLWGSTGWRQTTWIMEDLGDEPASSARSYLRTLYFSVTSITTVGYGDIVCVTEAETLANLVVILVSAFTFSVMVGALGMRVEDQQGDDGQKRRLMDKLSFYLTSRRFSLPLENRIRTYFEYYFSKQAVHSIRAVEELPTALRMEVALFNNHEVITSVPLFRDCELAFVKAIAFRLRPQMFMRGDYVVKEGELGQEMFFVGRGLLEVFPSDLRFLAYKYVGCFFGEVALLYKTPRTANVRALVQSEIYVLTAADYETLLTYYPDYRSRNKRDWVKASGAATIIDSEGYVKGASRPALSPLSTAPVGRRSLVEMATVGDGDESKDDELHTPTTIPTDRDARSSGATTVDSAEEGEEEKKDAMPSTAASHPALARVSASADSHMFSSSASLDALLSEGLHELEEAKRVEREAEEKEGKEMV